MSWKIKHLLDWILVNIIDNNHICLGKNFEKNKTLILFYSKFKYRIPGDSLQGDIDDPTAFSPMHNTIFERFKKQISFKISKNKLG